MKKKIAFFEVSPREREFFQQNLAEFELVLFPEIISEKHLPNIHDCEIISVLNYSPVTASLINQLSKTKLITSRVTGFDNIHLPTCREKNILVSNVPAYGDDTVAEFTLTLMLMLLRHAHQAYNRARNNNFSWEGLRGNNLKGKTLGIIGAGKIGLKVIKIAQGFGANILAYNRSQNAELAQKMNFTYASLEEVLANSDIISLHIPSTPATYHFLNQDNLSLVKKGALLINTSRGEVLDTKALIWALDQGIIQKAALDVLEEEKITHESHRLLNPVITPEKLERFALNHHLLHREDVLITPHIGFNTEEAFDNILNTSLSNIRSYLAGQADNLVKM